ncbi:SUR7/PalI family-domain-containing protein [Apodospora peruviana]|uniref:SUR7/PalI family-domain-containing protein n=1 Tax=Apodospora peruviana TaxID=516989 RepID=A0AAE0IIP0_9PEZI|nr:SUR7/PalI family-domain-containing protein [Apodospora peruviana]
MGKKMTLPSILRVRRRNHQTSEAAATSEIPASGKPSTSAPGSPSPPASKEGHQDSPDPDQSTTTINKAHIKRATKVRRAFAISASVSYALSVVFLILVIIGNTSNKRIINDIYFFKLDLTDIIPKSVPNASLINSIAQSIGLHDFYQVGLWNFCEGYQNVGITFCSKPQNLYWFNPVEVIMNELLAGATIALPTEVITILDVLRITSQIMFGFFITGAVINFIMIFLSPLAIDSRWRSLPLSLAAFFFSTMLVVGASIVGSVISFAFKFAATAQSDLNIHAYVGTKMFVFMWLASGFSLWGFIVHAGMGCCCVSRRDLRSGRRQVRNGVVQAG